MSVATATPMPSFAQVAQRLSEMATSRGEWCGVPMPLPDATLVIEDKNPWRDRLLACQAAIAKPAEHAEIASSVPPGSRIVNSWSSFRQRCRVYVVEHPNGKRCAYLGDHENSRRLGLMFATMKVGSDAWTLDTELTAIETLSGLLSERPHLFEAYAATGQFLETSPRSHICYVFRRGKPTLALSMQGTNPRIIAALCLHPIGYYDQSWAGSMTPTDDVIAHLMLMRCDERLFWRRANQHPAWSVEAGI